MNFHWSVAVALLAGGVFTLLGPLAVGAIIHRRTDARIYWFFIGAATFVVSQCILRLPWQIPLSMWVGKRIAGHTAWAVLWMAASALTAALFEECGRYVTFRWLMKERSWRAGLMVGAGHGGIEAMLLIAPNLVVAGVLYVLSGMGRMPALPPEAAQKLGEAFTKLTWWDATAGALERVGALAAHLAMSVMVAEGFVRGRPGRWLGVAIGSHFILDFAFAGGAILLVKRTGSALIGELALVPALVLSILVIRALRPANITAP
jgi:uncharacterized membrane protein YhfC